MALIIGQFSFLANNGNKIRAFAARYKIPTVYHTTGNARAGGLKSYGVDLAIGYGQAGAMHVARILEGTKPSELPVMQS